MAATKKNGTKEQSIFEILGLDKIGYTADQLDAYDVRNWISTGSLSLNALISGDPYKGVPSGRIIQLVGKSTSGKTFIGRAIANNAQKMGYHVINFESEWAIDNIQCFDRSKWKIVPCPTVEYMAQRINNMVNIIREKKRKEKFLILVDSLGNLSTDKERNEMLKEPDKQKKDMTRAQGIKALFRTITVDLGELDIPMIMINHQYNSMSMFTSKSVSGGTGVEFMPTATIELIKAKEKTKDGSIIGVTVTAKSTKNRLAKEWAEVTFNISYDHGLIKYSGLPALALKAGIMKKCKIGQKNGYHYKGKDYLPIELKGDEIWDDVMEKGGLAEWLRKTYCYGRNLISSKLAEEVAFLTENDDYDEAEEKIELVSSVKEKVS